MKSLSNNMYLKVGAKLNYCIVSSNNSLFVIVLGSHSSYVKTPTHKTVHYNIVHTSRSDNIERKTK